MAAKLIDILVDRCNLLTIDVSNMNAIGKRQRKVSKAGESIGPWGMKVLLALWFNAL